MIRKSAYLKDHFYLIVTLIVGFFLAPVNLSILKNYDFYLIDIKFVL